MYESYQHNLTFTAFDRLGKTNASLIAVISFVNCTYTDYISND